MKRSVPSRLGLFLLTLAMAPIVSCAASPPPKPPPQDPTVASLTEWLKLDAAQQERTRQLLQELEVRNAAIREKWEKGGRVRSQDLMASRGVFERDFLALLTDEQKRLWADLQFKFQTKGRRSPRPPS